MTFQPDLAGFTRLASDAPFPAAMQGAWADPATGQAAMTIAGRTLVLDAPMPVHDLFVRIEGDDTIVLNTLADTSRLDPDWSERTVFMFHLAGDGTLSITGFCDYWTLARPAAIDPATIRPPASPYQPLAPGEPFPQPLQGAWRGAWHGQQVVIGPREVAIDGERVDYLGAKLIRLLHHGDGPLCSLVLDLDAQRVAERFGAQALPMLNFQAFADGAMQGAGAGLRDAMFSPAEA